MRLLCCGRAEISGGRLEFCVRRVSALGEGEGRCGQRGSPSKVLRTGPAFPGGQSVPPHHSFAHRVHRGLWCAPISDGLGARILQTSLSDLGPGQGEASSGCAWTGWLGHVSPATRRVDPAPRLLGSPFVHCIPSCWDSVAINSFLLCLSPINASPQPSPHTHLGAGPIISLTAHLPGQSWPQFAHSPLSGLLAAHGMLSPVREGRVPMCL